MRRFISPACLALPWETLTPDLQRFQAMKMAIHTAMIRRMDLRDRDNSPVCSPPREVSHQD